MTFAFASTAGAALLSARRTHFVCTKARSVYTAAAVPRCTMALGEVDDEPAMPSNTAPPSGGPGMTEDTKLFVGNLSWDTTDHSLGDAFSRFGTVVDARVITDRFTGKSRGFGFIEYESSSNADEALEGMQGFEVDGRRIRVDRANKRAPRAPRRDDGY